MQEHVTDPYVQRAKAQGYRSRAAFKLLEIDARDRLFAPGQAVVDLGAAPGSWMQVARERVGPKGRIVGVDLLEVEPLAGAVLIQGDFLDPDVLAQIERELDRGDVDLVLSDMAPNISGIASADQARSIELAETACEFALAHLRPGGALLVKVFQGSGFPELLAGMRRRFASVAVRKPKASRDRSSEVYLLARTARAGARVP